MFGFSKKITSGFIIILLVIISSIQAVYGITIPADAAIKIMETTKKKSTIDWEKEMKRKYLKKLPAMMKNDFLKGMNPFQYKAFSESPKPIKPLDNKQKIESVGSLGIGSGVAIGGGTPLGYRNLQRFDISTGGGGKTSQLIKNSYQEKNFLNINDNTIFYIKLVIASSVLMVFTKLRIAMGFAVIYFIYHLFVS